MNNHPAIDAKDTLPVLRAAEGRPTLTDEQTAAANATGQDKLNHLYIKGL